MRNRRRERGLVFLCVCVFFFYWNLSSSSVHRLGSFLASEPPGWSAGWSTEPGATPWSPPAVRPLSPPLWASVSPW